MKKLKLNKERLTQLSNEESASIHGGGTNHSTQHNFTCCWCTKGDDSPRTASLDPEHCPPDDLI